jgi:hypothetical protein
MNEIRIVKSGADSCLVEHSNIDGLINDPVDDPPDYLGIGGIDIIE